MGEPPQRTYPPRRRRVLQLALVGSLLLTALWPESAPATVAEQRARLPPPKECENPVEGRWKAHIYEDWRKFWHAFTLEIRVADDDPEKLIGRILTQGWDGSAKDERPGPCQGGLHFLVSMTAKGTYRNGQVSFWGTKWKLDEVRCGNFGGYNLDRFTGKVDLQLQEFQSKNNDSGAMVNVPMVFRRVGCFDTDEQPDPGVKVKAPGFYPKKSRRPSAGCDCSW